MMKGKGRFKLNSKELKRGKHIIALILLIILLTLPLHTYVHYKTLYYLLVIFIYMPFISYQIIKYNTLDKKFYFKWAKKRKKGRLVNIFREALLMATVIVVTVMGGQLFANGRTPSLIIWELSTNESIGVLLVVLIFGVIGGISNWFRNEDRYKKIYLNSNDNEIIKNPPTEQMDAKLDD